MTQFRLDETIEVLRNTPATLQALLGGLSDAWTGCDEGPDTWSPFDIVGHLIQGEQADWMRRLEFMLEHGESRSFTHFDRFAQFETSKGKTLNELLETFAALRAANLRTLAAKNLQPEQLERRGAHPAFGSVTVRQLLATWAVHDLGHIAQISRVMAKRYSEEVGPWSEYLRILAG
jgi:uncharacterized damage-inducible protein DinB